MRYINRNYTGPQSGFRNQITNALIDIYTNWDLQLKALNVPYYLKIWLFDPRLTSSQVVCAIGDKIQHYNTVFYTDNQNIPFPSDKFKKADRIKEFKFEHYLDEEASDDTDFPERKFYKSESDFYYNQRRLKWLRNGNSRIEEFEYNGQTINAYFVRKGDIWVGGKK